jgi:hypothetical protein
VPIDLEPGSNHRFSRNFEMATTEPRKRTEWRVVCSQRPALNRLFKSGPAAAKYASGLEAQGLLGVRTNEHQITVWLARVRRVGAPDISKTFGRQADAEAWGREREGEIAKRQFVDYRAAESTSLGALFQKYDETRLAARDKNDPDRARIRKMLRHPVMQTRMSALTSGQIAGYRDERLKPVVKEVHGPEVKVKGATVKKELELMTLFFQYIARPGLQWYGVVSGHPFPPLPGIDDNLWQLMLGMLGLGGLRTFEKTKGVA